MKDKKRLNDEFDASMLENSIVIDIYEDIEKILIQIIVEDILELILENPEAMNDLLDLIFHYKGELKD
jgi:hypothetical protein